MRPYLLTLLIYLFAFPLHAQHHKRMLPLDTLMRSTGEVTIKGQPVAYRVGGRHAAGVQR